MENENHCDFTKLREMLIRTNMEDLRDTTHNKHYEVYRKHRLQEVCCTAHHHCTYPSRNSLCFQMGFADSDKPSSFAEQYSQRRESHLSSLQQKEEEMKQKFVIRVKEKESELKEAEKEVSGCNPG